MISATSMSMCDVSMILIRDNLATTSIGGRISGSVYVILEKALRLFNSAPFKA
jgi:hypothetical protein